MQVESQTLCNEYCTYSNPKVHQYHQILSHKDANTPILSANCNILIYSYILTISNTTILTANCNTHELGIRNSSDSAIYSFEIFKVRKFKTIVQLIRFLLGKI